MLEAGRVKTQTERKFTELVHGEKYYLIPTIAMVNGDCSSNRTVISGEYIFLGCDDELSYFSQNGMDGDFVYGVSKWVNVYEVFKI